MVLLFGLAAVVAYVDPRRIGIPADQFRLYAGQPAWFQSADIEGGPKISGRAVAR